MFVMLPLSDDINTPCVCEFKKILKYLYTLYIYIYIYIYIYMCVTY